MKYAAMALVLVLLILAGVWVSLIWPEPGRPRAGSSVLEQALAWYAKGHFERARADLKLYCEANPHHAEAKILYARVCIESGRTAEASKILEALNRNDATVLLLQAKIAKQCGQLDAASMLVQRALKLDAKNAAVWREIAFLQYEQGQHMQALTAIQRSLHLDPDQDDLSRLSAELSLQAATADMPNQASRKPAGMPTPDSFMPKMPGVPDPSSHFPTPTGMPKGAGRSPWK
jgi:tetratricopeptide (TPR) repeat protein